jgi:prevent-host-death family protein
VVIGDDHLKHPKQKPTHYNVAEAKAHFSTLVRKALQGEDVVIARDNQPLLRLVPVGVASRAPGSAKGRVAMAADFDAPLEDFAGYEK